MFEMITRVELIAIILVLLALTWELLVRPRLRNNKILTDEQLTIIDYACEVGVEYAEQIYLNGDDVDRNKLAIDYAFKVIEKGGYIPSKYTDVIKGVIEKKVYELPKTH